jgi:hypothetical protein
MLRRNAAFGKPALLQLAAAKPLWQAPHAPLLSPVVPTASQSQDGHAGFRGRLDILNHTCHLLS